MSETITLTIDGRKSPFLQGATILEAARQLDGDVPVICYHDATTAPDCVACAWWT